MNSVRLAARGLRRGMSTCGTSEVVTQQRKFVAEKVRAYVCNELCFREVMERAEAIAFGPLGDFLRCSGGPR